MVLGINIYPKGGGKSKQLLHCLDLDEIPMAEVRKLIKNASGIVTGYKRGLEHQQLIIEAKNLKEIADALTDILYVTYGAGHAYGIDLDKCFSEVQRSNMSKLGKNGKPIYNKKGKVMKGPKYFEPNLKQFIE